MVPGGVPLYPPSRANPRISGSADGLYRDLLPAHPERFLRLSPPAQRGGVDPPRGRPVGAGPHGTGGPAARAWSGNGRRGTDGGGACGRAADGKNHRGAYPGGLFRFPGVRFSGFLDAFAGGPASGIPGPARIDPCLHPLTAGPLIFTSNVPRPMPPPSSLKRKRTHPPRLPL